MLLLLAGTQAETASAWGSGCLVLKELGRNIDHCYALATWEMTGGSESVRGAVSNMTTESASEPEWANAGRLNDELWVTPEATSGWLESGQTYGNYYDCCGQHAFYAWVDTKYHEYLAPCCNPTATNESEIEDPSANGTWCIYWGSYVVQKCVSGYHAYSAELQAGVEAAGNTKPVNEASWEVAGVFHDGTWHAWKGAKTASHFETTGSEMCVTTNWGSPYAGNGVGWVC